MPMPPWLPAFFISARSRSLTSRPTSGKTRSTFASEAVVFSFPGILVNFTEMKVDFKKYKDGLVPAVIQDYVTQKVLMLGFMNEEALKQTEQTGKVTFYSRTKKRLWTKGEESGNSLQLRQILLDCDADSLLIKAEPK